MAGSTFKGVVCLAICGALAGGAWARGPLRASDGNTRGWQLMSEAERIEHQAKIRGFTDYASCRAYREEHHRLMAERAAAQGLPLRGGRHDFCAHLRPESNPGPASRP